MNKASKLEAASAIVAGMAESLIVAPAPVAKAPKAAKAAPAPKAAKAAKVASKKAAPVTTSDEAIKLTVRELAVVKAVASSEFADPKTKAVPSVAIAATFSVDPGMKAGVAKSGNPLPGIIASLKKKGLFETIKAGGTTMISLTKIGKEFASAAM